MTKQFDNSQAIREGWIMGDRSGDEVPFAIETLDDPSAHLGNTGLAFNSDGAASTHVCAQAAAGSRYHMDALSYLREHSPAGLEWALSWADGAKPRLRVAA